MNAKRFFYVCGGILFLIIAYCIGASRVGAQSGGDFTGIAFTQGCATLAIRADGSVFGRYAIPNKAPSGGVEWYTCTGPSDDHGWQYMGSVLGTVQSDPKSWSDVKKTFKK